MTEQTETPTAEAVEVPVIPGFGTDASSEATTPVYGMTRTDDHQYRMNGEGPFYSVTTMLDIIHKEPLYQWAKRIVAEIAVAKYDVLGEVIDKEGPQAAIDWLKGLPGYQRDDAARLGTTVHHLADLLGRDGKPLEAFGISERVLPYAQAVRRFQDDYRASENIVSSEKAVLNLTEAYAGQYDFLLMLNGELWLVDYKASRGIYPETGLQLAAYGHAEYIILANDPTYYPMPHIDRYGVVHIAPTQYEKGYRFVEYQVTDYDYRAFLAARDLWYWRREGRFQQKKLSTVDI